MYVTGNGHWKLGGFECACRFTEASPDFLKSIIQIRNESSIPPEESVCIYLLISGTILFSYLIDFSYFPMKIVFQKLLDTVRTGKK